MEKIKSFTINHDTLDVGMYLSRVDGDIVTYDIRLFRPNTGYYLSTGSAHTIEHLFATYARNSKWKDQVVYVGPMGCRTGCYLLVRDTVSAQDAIRLVQDSFLFIDSFEGEIPGSKKEECGNYLDHDLSAAKRDIQPFLKRMEHYTPEQLVYPE
jgi:S-ribosylhomocysteine lyase